MQKVLLSLLLCTALFSCEKNRVAPGQTVAMYKLQSFQLFQGRCQVEESTVILEQNPVVANNDIIAYSISNHTYELSYAATQRLKTLQPRNPFAVTVDGQVVFYVINMPMYMSSTCDHSITSNLSDFESKLTLNLGYPEDYFGSNVVDLRNDARLIETLRVQGKIVR